MFVFFTSCLCYKLFIICFLRGPLIAFQSKLKKRIDIFFLAGRVQTYQKDYCCLSVHAAMFASHQVCVIFRNKSASFNSQFEQQHLVQHASSTQEYCRSQQLLLFVPSTSTRVQKLIEMFFFLSTPFLWAQGPAYLLSCEPFYHTIFYHMLELIIICLLKKCTSS